MHPRRPQPQRRPPSLTTMCPISPAPPRPSHGLPSRISPPPTPGPPEHADQRPVRLPGAELELRVGRDLHVVADEHRRSRARSTASGRARSVPPNPAGCARRRSCRSRRRRSRVSRRRSPASADGVTLAAAHASLTATAIAAATSGGPPVVGVGRRAEPSTVFRTSTMTVSILVPPRSIPANRSTVVVRAGARGIVADPRRRRRR